MLVSAGEASGDLYASLVVEELRRLRPEARIFRLHGAAAAGGGGAHGGGRRPAWRWWGCWRWWRTFRGSGGNTASCWRRRGSERPDLAILTDSPDFHLRVARQLRRQGVPVVYLVAPQAWAWRRRQA